MNEKYTVNEYCPFCDSDIEMTWDVPADGYEAFCPHCGKKLMLCDECLHSEDNTGQRCDFTEGEDGKGHCHRRKE